MGNAIEISTGSKSSLAILSLFIVTVTLIHIRAKFSRGLTLVSCFIYLEKIPM
jgi:hypothetical protein